MSAEPFRFLRYSESRVHQSARRRGKKRRGKEKEKSSQGKKKWLTGDKRASNLVSSLNNCFLNKIPAMLPDVWREKARRGRKGGGEKRGTFARKEGEVNVTHWRPIFQSAACPPLQSW